MKLMSGDLLACANQCKNMIKKLVSRFDTPVHHEQIRALYQQSPFVFLGIVFTMSVVTVFFWNKVEQTTLLVWLLSNAGLTIARVILVRSFHRLKPTGEQLVTWGLVFAASATLSGMIWGSIAFLFLSPSDIEGLLLIAIVLTGMTSGSLVPLSSFMPAYYGFCVPALIPFSVIMLNQEAGVLVLIGYLVLAFVAVNLGYSFVVNRNLASFIRLRFENLGLLEDLKLQKNIAEQANTDKSRFLAATSHDLRQPLHAMDLYLGALKKLLTKQEQIHLLEKSQQSSAALNSLLTALMDVSRLDAGNVVIDRGVVDISLLMKTISDEYQEQANKRGILFDLQTPELLVDSDPLMLGRLLRNLVNNACYHSGGSRILLRAEKQGEEVLVSVCDDGIGIAEQQQSKVFSEFYQLNNPERDRSKGLGLGLAIVKRLAGLLQHDLQLESAPGEGCCFIISLPLADEAAVEEPVDIIQEQGDVSGLFIILVDDEADIRNALRCLLLQWGCELLVADSLQTLQQELSTCQYPTPDILLCDYRLRENQTGLDIVDAMRKYFNIKIPALIISGDTDKKIEEKVIGKGCKILHKPVSPDILRSEIVKGVGSGVIDT